MRAFRLAVGLLIVLAACDPGSPLPPASGPSIAAPSPTLTDGPEVVSCRGLNIPFDGEVNTNLDREGGLLDFSFYVPKLQRARTLTIRYRDDPWCRRNPDTRRLIQHVGAGRGVVGCLDLPDEPPAGMTRVELWFAGETAHDPSRTRSLVVHRDLPTTDGIAAAAVRAWIDGPTRAERKLGARAIGNPEMELLGIDIVGGVVRVDVDEAFHDTGLGTCCEGLVLQGLVGTLTQFPSVRRVMLYTEGVRSEYWGGHAGILNPRGETRPDPHWYRVASSC